MPFANYESHTDCVQKNKGKDDPHAYCAAVEHKATGKWPAEKDMVLMELEEAMRIEKQLDEFEKAVVIHELEKDVYAEMTGKGRIPKGGKCPPGQHRHEGIEGCHPVSQKHREERPEGMPGEPSGKAGPGLLPELAEWFEGLTPEEQKRAEEAHPGLSPELARWFHGKSGKSAARDLPKASELEKAVVACELEKKWQPTYYCTKCKERHYRNSAIGKKHAHRDLARDPTAGGKAKYQSPSSEQLAEGDKRLAEWGSKMTESPPTAEELREMDKYEAEKRSAAKEMERLGEMPSIKPRAPKMSGEAARAHIQRATELREQGKSEQADTILDEIHRRGVEGWRQSDFDKVWGKHTAKRRL